jgi:hypothetical protein
MNILITVLVCIVLYYVSKKVFRKRTWGNTDAPASSGFHTDSDPGDETDRLI